MIAPKSTQGLHLHYNLLCLSAEKNIPLLITAYVTLIIRRFET